MGWVGELRVRGRVRARQDKATLKTATKPKELWSGRVDVRCVDVLGQVVGGGGGEKTA